MRDKHSKLWRKIRKKKIAELEGLGIMSCEMCHSTGILDLAHSKKRRKIENEEELAEVALLCRQCHNFIEYNLTQPEMEKVVREIIERRCPQDILFND